MYAGAMNDNDRLRRHLEFCKRVYERMKREGIWPWGKPTKGPVP